MAVDTVGLVSIKRTLSAGINSDQTPEREWVQWAVRLQPVRRAIAVAKRSRALTKSYVVKGRGGVRGEHPRAAGAALGNGKGGFWTLVPEGCCVVGVLPELLRPEVSADGLAS